MSASVVGIVWLGGCGSKSNPDPQPSSVPQLSLSAVPAGLRSGDSASFDLSWTGGNAPYTVNWNFGGWAIPPGVSAVTSSRADSQTVVLSNPAGGTYNLAVSVTDALGAAGTATAQVSYGPLPGGNFAPQLSLVSGAGTDRVTVRATDQDGGSLTIYATPPIGMGISSAPSVEVESGGTATFNFTAADMFEPQSGDAGFSAFDGHSSSPLLAVQVQAGYELLSDTLYAIPLSKQAVLGESVKVVIATGVPASPFQYANGVRLVVPAGTEFNIYRDFDYGLPNAGGGKDPVPDGFWGIMNPSGGFLLMPDDYPGPGLLPDGRWCYDLNVTPIGGHDMTGAKGALCNLELTFPEGNNELSFQAEQLPGLKRTFYSDGAANEYFWSDISNNHPGIPNSVTVESASAASSLEQYIAALKLRRELHLCFDENVAALEQDAGVDLSKVKLADIKPPRTPYLAGKVEAAQARLRLLSILSGMLDQCIETDGREASRVWQRCWPGHALQDAPELLP